MSKKPANKPKKSPIQTTIYSYLNNVTPAVTRIFDKKDKSNIGILYWNQETLEKLTELSGPLATANEYQIHYWSLVARQTFDDGSILDIAFPTAIFNYEQEVSGAHIDFELKDVKEVSDAIQPIHNVVTNQLLPQLQAIFKDVSVEFLSVPMNTMHRHPTGVASFSGTDLKKNHLKDTGIVFPLQSANETPSFSSIIYNNPVKMVHSEYRIATGNTEDKDGIKYREGRCATYVKGQIAPRSIAEKFIGIAAKDTTHLVTKDAELAKISLEDMLNSINYEPNTQFVKKENLKKKTYTYYNSGTVVGKNKTFSTVESVLTYSETSIRNCTIPRLKEMSKILDDDLKKTHKSELEAWDEYSKVQLQNYVIKLQKVARDKKERRNIGNVQEQTLVYDKAQVKEIKDTIKIDILDYSKMMTMAAFDLKNHCLKLDNYYYQTKKTNAVSEYATYAKTDIIDEILELQDFILDEFYNSPDTMDEEFIMMDMTDDDIPLLADEEHHLFMNDPIFEDGIPVLDEHSRVPQSEKISALRATGMKEQAITNANPATINRWYSDLMK
jgi:hypothetical protein